MAGGEIDRILASGIVTVGPIDAIDVSKGAVRVLGQNYKVGGSAAVLAALSERVATGASPLATIRGTRDKTGQMRASSMSLSKSSYTPGATQVIVVGKVSRANTAIATFMIGGLTVDYSAALAGGSIDIVAGQTVAVIGSRSGSNMPLIATALRPL